LPYLIYNIIDPKTINGKGRTSNMRSTARIYLLIASLLFTACTYLQGQPPDSQPVLADKLILYSWPVYISPQVIADFTAEYGIEVVYQTYMSQDQALSDLRQGKVYDVVTFDNSYLPTLVAEDLIEEIDYEYVTNIKNISVNFRDLVFDYENEHSVPFNWGTVGLMVREDASEDKITNWSDLWTIAEPEKILLWKGAPREVIGLTLRSLGYSVNSEDGGELKQAEEKLMLLRPHVVFIDDLVNPAAFYTLMEDPNYPVALGWGDFAVLGSQQDPPIAYILPAEGTILRGDNLVIPASSPRKETAELFIDYLLRPEVSAQITNHTMMASANDAAREYVDPTILENPIIYPHIEQLQQHAETILPLSAKGEELAREIWDRFVNWQP
jgi:spermidine/putrescine transport system substrate-binding protein